MSRMRQCGARGGHFRDFHVERFDALLGERANPRAVVLRLEFQQFAAFLQRKTRRLRRADEFNTATVILIIAANPAAPAVAAAARVRIDHAAAVDIAYRSAPDS